jgi:hypothetical protein
MAGPPDDPAAHPLRRVRWGELALLVALAAALHSADIGESLWLDELFTAWVALGSDGTLAERAELGNANPVFYRLVRLSVATFGPTEWAVRLPSIAFGALVPAVVYLFARAVTGSDWGGRVAGLLAALDGLSGAYGAEARPYPLVEFFGVVQLLAFWALVGGAGWGWRVTLVAATVALGYSHFIALAILGGELAFYALLWLRGDRPRYRPVPFACDLTAAALLLLPLVPLVLTVAGRRGNFHLTVRMVLLEDLVGHHRQTAYLLLPAIAATVAAFVRRRKTVETEPGVRPFDFRSVAFVLVVFYGTALPLWALHRAGGPPLFTIRYTTILLLLPLVGAGLCVVGSPSRWVGIAFALVALALGQLTEGAARRRLSSNPSPRLVSEDWRGAVDHVNAHGGRAPVFVRAGLIETDAYLATDEPLTRAYLTLPVRTLYRLDPPDRPVQSLTFAGDLPVGADFELVRQSGEAWFVVKGDAAPADQVASRAAAALAAAGIPVTVADRVLLRNVVAFRLIRKGSAR